MKNKTDIKARILRLLSFAVGAGILAFGLYNIHSRTSLSEGGVLGLSLLIYHWTGVSPGISAFIMDMTAFALGTLVMGKGFLGDSVAASAMYMCWYRLFEHIGPALPDLSAHPFLCALLGGILVGTGCGLIVRHDCAAGGDDALVLVMNKLTGVRLALLYFINDFVVLMLSLTYIPFRKIGWSLLSVVVSSGVIELFRYKTEKSRKNAKQNNNQPPAE